MRTIIETLANGTQLYACEGEGCDCLTTNNLCATCDGRTESQQKMDAIAGNKDATKLDKQYGRVLKAANDLFGNKATRKYLLLGEESYTYIHMYVSGGGKRSDATARLTELLHESGLGLNDIRVNDWTAVYGLARLCTGVDSVKDMPHTWIGSVAYRSLAELKVAIERDETDYVFKAGGWALFTETAIATGVKGRALTEAIKEQAEYADNVNRTNRLKGLSPERVEQLQQSELAKERDKQITAINKAAENIRDKALEANLSPDDLLYTLVNRGVITAPEPIERPMTPVEMANGLTVETASDLAYELVKRGHAEIIMAMAATLSGWVKANADAIKVKV